MSVNPRKISLPSVVGYDWTNHYEEPPGFESVDHQITWIRGTNHIDYSTRIPGRKWTTTPVTSPERFGFDGTEKTLHLVVEAFTNNEQSNQEES